MILADLVPKRFLVPLRYNYHRLTGRLEDEIKILPQLVPRFGRAIDVGAFNGEYAYVLSKLSHSVECFEPQAELASNIEAYHSDRIRVHLIGLSNLDGTQSLRIPLAGEFESPALASLRKISGPSRQFMISVRRLDSFFFQDVSFIKIDVEGYEAQVIEGAEATIARDRPVLLIEIEQRHLDYCDLTIHDIFQKVIALGYEGFFFKMGQLKKITEFSYEKDQARYLHDPHSRNYINNFVFRPKDQ